MFNWFIALETVLSPEDRRVIFYEGSIYPISALNDAAEAFGIDNVKCQLCTTSRVALVVKMEMK